MEQFWYFACGNRPNLSEYSGDYDGASDGDLIDKDDDSHVSDADDTDADLYTLAASWFVAPGASFFTTGLSYNMLSPLCYMLYSKIALQVWYIYPEIL